MECWVHIDDETLLLIAADEVDVLERVVQVLKRRFDGGTEMV